MLIKNGRISWPIFFAIIYSTLIILAVDLAWRLVAGPVAYFAAAGLAALVVGNAAIYALGVRGKSSST